jgi:hypothetical protein
MKTIKMTVSTKKGEYQALRFLVVQEIPYPDIASDGGRISWRNFGGLFDQYGRKADGIGSNYYCYLLADTAPDIVPDDYNRTLFAGYTDYHDQTKVNGGTFKFRGKDLGEMSIHFGNNPDYPDIKLNGFNAPTSSERDAIRALICPELRQFITENRVDLKAEAVDKIKNRFAAELRETRESLNALEAQAAKAVF